ncbi:hypothetical protein U9M48_043688 [Paspalum notatum var. saurae]|uniref:Uncharacterized protein n=1 Tax=Paspalum notatum var. saurae TaxID=547442 RepID=A0AAQ3UTZ9_PASNO
MNGASNLLFTGGFNSHPQMVGAPLASPAFLSGTGGPARPPTRAPAAPACLPHTRRGGCATGVSQAATPGRGASEENRGRATGVSQAATPGRGARWRRGRGGALAQEMHQAEAWSAPRCPTSRPRTGLPPHAILHLARGGTERGSEGRGQRAVARSEAHAATSMA